MTVRLKRAVRAGPGSAMGRRAGVDVEGPQSKTVDLNGESVRGLGPTGSQVPLAYVANPYPQIYTLERNRGSFEILFLVNREGAVSKYRMRKVLLPRQEALSAALRNLVKMRLVEQVGGHRFPFEKRYRLTSRGQEFVTTALQTWDRALAE